MKIAQPDLGKFFKRKISRFSSYNNKLKIKNKGLFALVSIPSTRLFGPKIEQRERALMAIYW